MCCYGTRDPFVVWVSVSPTEPRRRAKGVLHPLPVAARMQAVGLSASEVGRGSHGEGCGGRDDGSVDTGLLRILFYALD